MMEFETEKDHGAGMVSPGRLARLFFCTVVLLLFAAAVLSYAPADAAIIYGGVSREPENWIGWSGAWLAHILFMHIGLAVYLLLLLVLIRAVRSALNEFSSSTPGFKRWQGLCAAAIMVFGAVLLLGLVPETFAEILPVLGLGHADAIKSGHSGGVIGQFFSAPRNGELTEGVLRHLIGSAGCAIVGMAAVFASLIWLYFAEWKELVCSCFAASEEDIPRSSAVDQRQTRFSDLPFTRQTQGEAFQVRTAPAAPVPAVAVAPAPAPAPAPCGTRNAGRYLPPARRDRRRK